MATYDLGAGEIVSLQTSDFDWERGLLHVRRPKTDCTIELPLLPAVGRIVSSYLRDYRPPGVQTHAVFVAHRLPHGPMSTSAIRFLVRSRGLKAGLPPTNLGSHVLRHSHATRQVDAGVSLKIVGDILGHRRSETTSTYVRVALQHLRGVALPVPR
jgi:integrase/recombinase XerD